MTSALSLSAPAARSHRGARGRDVVFVIGLAAFATAAMCGARDRAGVQGFALATVLALVLRRWHARRDFVGLAVGVVLGDATELVSDLGGVWVHAHPVVLGVAPIYVLLCYPVLGVALPRLVDALVGDLRGAGEGAARAGAYAGAVWAVHVGGSYFLGRDNAPEAALTAVCLAALLARFRSRHDLVTAAFGAALGLVWELPATVSGVWWFPHPQIFGLIPAWLPFAYAVFFLSLGRVTAALGEVFGAAEAKGQ